VLIQLASNVRTSTFSVLCFGGMGCLQLGFGCESLGRWAIWRVPSLAVDRTHDHHMRPVSFFVRISLFLAGWAVGGVWLGGWVGGVQVRPAL
jgi:hypothetical protein